MKELFNLTAPQKALWLTEQYYQGSNINNVCGTCLINDKFNVAVLKQAINNVVCNNTAFRLHLSNTENGIMQYVSDFEQQDFDVVELKQEQELKSLEQSVVNQTFKLFESNLFSCIIFKFKDKTGGFIFNTHHLICDGFSLGLTCKKIMQEYSKIQDSNNLSNKLIGIIKNDNTNLDASINNKNESNYLDYIVKEKNYFKSNNFEKDKEYWETKLKTVPNIVSLSKNCNVSLNPQANRCEFSFGENLSKKIKEYCKKNKVSINSFFMAVISLYIFRVTNTNNFVIGTPVLNRIDNVDKHTNGLFVNVQPFIVDVLSHGLFLDYIKQISINSIGFMRHQHYPSSESLKFLRNQNQNYSNLYNILFSYQITSSQIESGISYRANWVFNNTNADELDIQVFDFNNDNVLKITYDYKIEKFSKNEIDLIHNRIDYLIRQIIELNQENIQDLDVILPNEKHELLDLYNNTKVDYDKDKTIVELFEEQVQKTPYDTAILFKNETITYRDLNEKANVIANYLRNNYKIKNGDFVAILQNRSINMIVSILGVVKAGCTYVAVDPDYPIDRVEYMLDNCEAKTVIINENTKNLVKDIFDYVDINKILNSQNYINNKELIKNVPIITKAEDLLYVIYTSGSTGKPKGVSIKNYNVHNFVVAMRQIVDFNSVKSFACLATCCFDMFVYELWGSLLNGLKMVLADENEQKIPPLLNKMCIKNNIDIIQTTPSRLKLLLDNNETDCLKNVKHIFIGGEYVPEYIFEELEKYSNIMVHHMYGPTETTVWSSHKLIVNTKKITIGKPIANTQIYILNNGRLAPKGTEGEIFIAGDGVGNGYLNKIKLTNDVFVPNIFSKDENSVMYNTGDIGFINEYNELVYIGRGDGQVKINGYRVELNEIENIVLSFDEIINAVVVKKTINNADVLCCYYIIKEDTVFNLDEVKMALKNILPNYMVPKFFVQMEEFPYTNNGKIDRRNMPMPKLEIDNEPIVAARNDLDVKLISVICNNLEIENVSIDKNLFEIGLDSLLAINLSVRIYNEFKIEFGVNEIFNNPTIRAISDIINSKINDTKIKSDELDLNSILNNKKAQIPKAKIADFYPVSNSQRRMYLACQNNEQSILYNISGVIKFKNMVNIELLRNGLLVLLNRNESFRTYFELRENEIVQRIDDNVEFVIEEEDIQTLSEEKKKEYLELNGEINVDNIMHDFIKPFDLKKAPLVRFKILKNKDKVNLLIDAHHIICDGTSLGILAKDLMRLYDGENLPDIQLTYKDYSVWEQSKENTKNYKVQEEFWLKNFEGEIPLLNLPLVKPRSAVKSYNGALYKYVINTELFNKVKKCAKEFNTTPNIILLCCYFLLLYKYTNQNDLIVGMPISGRTILELNNVIGVFINTLPIRFNIDNKESLKETLNRLKDICSGWYNNQDYSLEDLASKLTSIRDNSRNFLFDTMFIYQSSNYTELKSNNLKCEVIRPDNKTSKLDISLEVMPNENNYALTYEYCTDLFDEEYIKKFAYRYETLLNNFVDNINAKIQNISMLDETETSYVLYGLNDNKKSFDYKDSLINMFERQVKRTPDNIAVVFENKTITYKKFNEKANQIAHYIETLNLDKDDFIALMLPRSIEILICIWGCLKAGICYIPIDTALPINRINYMLSNSNIKTIFTFDKILDEFGLDDNLYNVIDVRLDSSSIYKNNDYKKNNLEKEIDIEQQAYAIYTSGSTGKPKGVVLKQKALTNLTHYLNDYVDFMKNNRANTSMLSITTISFDIFIFETIICMQAGLKIVMSSEQEQNSPLLLDKLIKDNRVKCIQTTPSRMNLFVQNYKLMPNLSKIDNFVLAGEPLAFELKEKLLEINPNAKIYNGYGPSETTIFSTFTDVTNQSEITIGKPLYNTYAYIMDSDNNLLPEGIPGELYIAGDGVGKLYINNEKITKERFINDPFNEGIMYRTGDLVKWLPDGDLHYIGRNDNQVKIRGLRIELDEIEKCILSYDGIIKCIVHIKKDANDREFVVAYYMAKDRINSHELRKYVAQNLPKYMVPSYYVLLDKLPYLPNGKVDKKALPEPEKEQNLENKCFIAPETTLEFQLANIFEVLLGIDKVSINDNFFELGGDSLLAINLQIELNKLGYSITYADLFLNSTILDIENYIITHTSKEEKEEQIKVIDKNISQYNQMIIDYTRMPNNIVSRNIGNVLITGTTGFLGSHVLEQFLLNETGIAYVVVRPEKGMTLREKFLKKLHYYFGDKYDAYIDRRIIIMSIDITKPDLGSTWRELKVMFNNINCIINCAAIVSHFGNYNVFKDINVDGVKNLLELCKQYKKKFIQISTVSISGVNLSNNLSKKKMYFSENNLYIEQPLDNVYVKSKFEAEKLVLDYINQGVDAYIMRVGNLTNRISDMKFQPNSKENAFIQRIISFIKLKTVPDYLLEEHLEFTPVDSCSRAIILLTQATNGKNRIFHVYNNNEVSIIDFITALDNHGIKVKIVEEDEFIKVLKTTVNKKDSSLILGGIMKDLNKEQKFQYHSNIVVSNDFTNDYLKDLFFKWSEINKEYLDKFIEFLLNLM